MHSGLVHAYSDILKNGGFFSVSEFLPLVNGVFGHQKPVFFLIRRLIVFVLTDENGGF